MVMLMFNRVGNMIHLSMCNVQFFAHSIMETQKADNSTVKYIKILLPPVPGKESPALTRYMHNLEKSLSNFPGWTVCFFLDVVQIWGHFSCTWEIRVAWLWTFYTWLNKFRSLEGLVWYNITPTTVMYQTRNYSQSKSISWFTLFQVPPFPEMIFIDFLFNWKMLLQNLVNYNLDKSVICDMMPYSKKNWNDSKDYFYRCGNVIEGKGCYGMA